MPKFVILWIIATIVVVIFQVNLVDCRKSKLKNGYKNIVFIVADDIGWSDIGYANPAVLTPNINNLATNGIILNQSYAYPLCTPSRSSFLTGVYAERSGLQHSVIQPQEPVGLPTDFVLLPEVLKQFGYATHIVGKWHLGFCSKKYTPCYRGFDSFYGYFNAQNDYLTHRVLSQINIGEYDGLDYWNQTTDYLVPILNQNQTYSMFTYTERAIDILKNHDKSEPFFLYFASQNAHVPIEVPAEYENKYPNVQDPQRRKYLGMVSVLDDAVGNLTKTLSSLGLLDDTIIFFTSDNGGATYAEGRNYPLRGGKMTVWEGGTRVRGFINGKDLKPNVYEGMLHAVDWMPTIVNAAIGTPVQIKGIDGINQWQSITQNQASQRYSFIYNIDPIGTIGCTHPTEAVRNGDWKLIRGCPGQYNDWYPIPTYNKQFVENIYNKKYYFQHKNLKINDTVLYLFNIKNDPLETTDLSAQHPDIVNQLEADIEYYKKFAVPPLNPPSLIPDNDSNPAFWGDTWSPGWC